MRTTTAILAAVAMTLMAFAPVAYASTNPNDEFSLSRTFLNWGSIEWKPHSQNPDDQIGGVGWYHPDDRSGLCLFRLFGVTASVGFYYEGVPKPRVTISEPNLHLMTFPETGISPADPCPTNPGATPGQFLGTSEFNVYVGGQVAQSHLLCFKSFDVCNADPDTARWHLYDCNGYDGTGLGKKNANHVEFDHGGLLGGLLPIGSSAVFAGCMFVPSAGGIPGEGTSGMKGYNVTDYLNEQLGRQSSLPDVHLDQLRLNQGANTGPMETTYVVSCFSMEFDKFPPFPGGQRILTTSHDYFLALGPDVANWAAALLYHELPPSGAPGKKATLFGPSLAEQGLYDLSGQNGCPSNMNHDLKVLCVHPSLRGVASTDCTDDHPNKVKPKSPLLPP